MHKFKIGPYKGLDLRPVPLFTEDDLNLGLIESTKKLIIKWAENHMPAELGDEVIVKLHPECENMFVPELSNSNFRFTLGDPSIPEQFQVVTWKTGDDLIITIPFPQNYSIQRISGKNVTFYINVLEVIHHRLPVVITDEMARQIDSEVTGLEELQDKLRGIISENWLHSIEEEKIQTILQKIASTSEYELDQEELIKARDSIMTTTNAKYSSNPEIMEAILSGNDEPLVEQSSNIAKKTIVDNLIITDIIRLENITIEPPELDEAKRSFIEFAEDESSYDQLFPNEDSFQQYMLREKVFHLLLEWNSGVTQY